MTSALHHAIGDWSLVQEARKIIANRTLRRQLFPTTIFGEPAWDILLVLYSQSTGTDKSVATLSKLTDAPLSTIIRWVKYLEDAGLVMREPNHSNHMRDLVHLTDKASRALQFYLLQVARDGQ
jgi:DNA-binding MarR family transcriptional regulator